MDVKRICVHVVLLFSFVSFVQGQGFTTCHGDYEKVGCFSKTPTKMDLLVNDRETTSKAHQKGHLLQWDKFAQSIHSLACRCRAKATEGGYAFFSIHHWAECYGGKDTAKLQVVRGDASKKSKDCVNLSFQPCNDADKSECVGKDDGHYIFSINRKGENKSVVFTQAKVSQPTQTLLITTKEVSKVPRELITTQLPVKATTGGRFTTRLTFPAASKSTKITEAATTKAPSKGITSEPRKATEAATTKQPLSKAITSETAKVTDGATTKAPSKVITSETAKVTERATTKAPSKAITSETAKVTERATTKAPSKVITSETAKITEGATTKAPIKVITSEHPKVTEEAATKAPSKVITNEPQNVTEGYHPRLSTKAPLKVITSETPNANEGITTNQPSIHNNTSNTNTTNPTTRKRLIATSVYINATIPSASVKVHAATIIISICVLLSWLTV